MEYSKAPESDDHSTARLKRGGFFSGSGIAIFIGLGIAAVLITVLTTHYGGAASTAHPRDLRQVQSIVPAKQTPVPSPPEVDAAALRIALSPELFRVTAISLGHPRLAVINRQQVAEGDWINVYTPNACFDKTARDQNSGWRDRVHDRQPGCARAIPACEAWHATEALNRGRTAQSVTP